MSTRLPKPQIISTCVLLNIIAYQREGLGCKRAPPIARERSEHHRATDLAQDRYLEHLVDANLQPWAGCSGINKGADSRSGLATPKKLVAG